MDVNNKEQSLNNFEKLCFQILELKSETLKTFDSIKQYYLTCINEQKPFFKLENLLTAFSKNKKIADENILNVKSYLSKKVNQKNQTITALQEEFKLLKEKFKILLFGKEKMKEINKMKKSELISVQFQISKLSKKIKIIQKECLEMDSQINKLTEENKNSYSTECTLLEQVMAFDKKLYNIYNAREQKIKEKHNLEIELKSLTDSQRRKTNDKINKLVENFNNQISNLKINIEKFEKENIKIKEEKNYIENLNELIINKINKISNENSDKSNDIDKKTINQLNLNLIEESHKLDEDVNTMILKIQNEFKGIIKIESPKNILPLDYLNMLFSNLQNFSNDNSYENLINKKSEEVSKLGEEISITIYKRFLKKKAFLFIKEYSSKEKKRKIDMKEKEKEREKKIKEEEKKNKKKKNKKNDTENNNEENEENKSTKNDEVKNKKKKSTEFNLNSMDFLNELSRSVIQADESESNQQHFGRRRRPYHF